LQIIRRRGAAFISVRDEDRCGLEPIARSLSDMGFELAATGGTARCINDLGIRCDSINKVMQGSPHVVDLMREGRGAMVINTPEAGTNKDSFSIRRTGPGTAPAILHHTRRRPGSGNRDRRPASRPHHPRRPSGLPSRVGISTLQVWNLTSDSSLGSHMFPPVALRSWLGIRIWPFREHP
jgi:hypothetical protein